MQSPGTSTIPDALQAALGTHYALERELGRGGMATVYLARDIRHRRAVAVKVLRAELAAALGPERFLREIELTAGLQHPHILTLHDSGVVEGLRSRRWRTRMSITAPTCTRWTWSPTRCSLARIRTPGGPRTL